MPATEEVDVAIVGGGFGGSMLAAHLLRAGTRDVTLIERHPPAGRGVAYGTTEPGHLLNVPAAEMSAWSERPDDFARWLAAGDSGLGPADFAPRRLYGAYVGEQLAEAAAMSVRHFELVCDEAVSFLPEDGRFRLGLASGRVLHARAVVLAIGLAPPAPLRLDERLYVAEPWSDAALRPLNRSGDVLLVGTGLTAVDVALSLLARDGTRRVYMLSRRARLPAAQREGAAYREWLTPETVVPRASALLSAFRRELAIAAAQGHDWRAVLDAMRRHVPALWQRLPWVERRRFLRHLRPFWEAHRNRLPPETARQVEALQASGRLAVVAGRLVGLARAGEALVASVRTADGLEDWPVERVINCTGPEPGYRRGAQRVVQDVLGAGLARLDPLGLGLEVGPGYELLDEDGVPTPGLYAVGAPAKGRWWEVMAVSELRGQVAELAGILARR